MYDLPVTTTLSTLSRRGTRLCARAITLFARLAASQVDFFGGSVGGFFEVQCDFGFDVGTTTTAATSASEHVAKAEDIAERIEDIFDVTKSGSGTTRLVDAGVPVAIVASPLVRVGQNFVGFGGLFEFLGGFFVALIAVRVKLDRQLAIRRRDITL